MGENDVSARKKTDVLGITREKSIVSVFSGERRKAGRGAKKPYLTPYAFNER